MHDWKYTYLFLILALPKKAYGCEYICWHTAKDGIIKGIQNSLIASAQRNYVLKCYLEIVFFCFYGANITDKW